ncbi:MAG: DUF815 domain-containing protein, partial [Clostridiales bacterium]|nr:DUF815 domain-containing protein [Clostridiales bacterium]
MSASGALANARFALASLALFRGLLFDPVVHAFQRLAEAAADEKMPLERRVDRYAAFTNLLYEAGEAAECGFGGAAGENDRGGGAGDESVGIGYDWTRYLLTRTLRDENRCIKETARGRAIPAGVARAVSWELSMLERVGGITSAEALDELGCAFPLAGWETSRLDFAAAYREHIAHISERGYGLFAESHVFRLRDGGGDGGSGGNGGHRPGRHIGGVGGDGFELVPVPRPDPVDAAELTGYGRERDAIFANTLALMAGKPASNALLY